MTCINILYQNKNKTMPDDLIIIECDALPETGENGKWYHFDGNYYFWDGVENKFTPVGGDRPTRPPVNP